MAGLSRKLDHIHNRLSESTDLQTIVTIKIYVV